MPGLCRGRRIGAVLGTVAIKNQGANAATNATSPPWVAPAKPRTKWWVKLLSGPLLFVLSGVIHLLAAYLLLSAVLNYYLPSPDPV
jgi:hypothetical protein